MGIYTNIQFSELFLYSMLLLPLFIKGRKEGREEKKKKKFYFKGTMMGRDAIIIIHSLHPLSNLKFV